MNRPSPHPLEGCWQRLEWAKINLETLQGEVAAFFGDPSNPDTPRGHLESKGTSALPSKRFEPPWHWALLTGDIIHSFRSALNYLAWELARLNLRRVGKARRPKRATQFPILREAERWADVQAARLADVGKAERELIEGFQSYNAEKAAPPVLAWLNALSNRDKHQTLNLVLVHAGGMDERVEKNLVGWAFVCSSKAERAVHQSATGEVKGEFHLKATYHVAIEDFARIDWILDGIGPKVAEIIGAFEPVFEDA